MNLLVKKPMSEALRVLRGIAVVEVFEKSRYLALKPSKRSKN